MKYSILISAVLMQMCLGATYSWSVYVQPIRMLTGLQQGPVQLPFTTFYFIFPLTMIAAGALLPRFGPRLCSILGGILFGSGWLLASFGNQHFFLTTLGIGVCAGVGAGLAYLVPIAVCIRWFPEKKGLVTGVAVAGFGGGAALVSQLGGWLMESFDKTPFETFFIFGLIFLFTVTGAGAVMRFPVGASELKSVKPIGVRELANNQIFRILYLAMFVGLAAGFAINANLKELYSGTAEGIKLGVTGVSLFALANASGRIIWGTIFDRMKAATVIQANLLLQALVLIIAPTFLDSTEGFLAISLLTGFNYGGVLVIYVSTASRCWGAERVSQIYGWLFSSNIPASFCPILAGLIFDAFQSFNPALYGLAAMLLGGVISTNRTAAKINSFSA
jgi:OFA family oxalate/formate antiporter-like MFS transporter